MLMAGASRKPLRVFGTAQCVVACAQCDVPYFKRRLSEQAGEDALTKFVPAAQGVTKTAPSGVPFFAQRRTLSRHFSASRKNDGSV